MVIRKRVNPLIYLLLLLPIKGWGLERQPWIGNYLEFDWRQIALYQTYSKIDEESYFVPYSSDNIFVTTQLSNAIKPDFSLGIEATLAHTRHQKINVDHLSLGGRYVLKDDISGDLVSLTAGFHFTQSFKNSLNDISSFHHGRAEVEAFLSIGQENAQGKEWNSRWYFSGGIGIADRGSPWLDGRFVYENRFLSKHQYSLFLNSLYGLGHQSLHLHHFHGYGSIAHRSIDLGIGYVYWIDYFGSLAVEYSKRVYARNFPVQTDSFLIKIVYVFGL
jgi:hypothetical protein